MRALFKLIIFYFGFTILFLACKNTTQKNHGPILLGDSSTIVTEKDPKKLMDLVIDLNPDIPPASTNDSVEKEKKNNDVTKNTKQEITEPNLNDNNSIKQSLPDVAGLKADFKEISILIPNVTAKLSGNPNLKAANGAVYTLLSGALQGNAIHTTGKVLKISQKYQSVVVVKNKYGTLPLDNLTSTSDWEPLKIGKNGYAITGLEEDMLSYPKINNITLRNAVTKAANKRRLNRKKLQEWISSISNVHSANQKPLTIILRSVMWKIDGKDEGGKSFSKQIRIDLPL